MGFFSLCVAVTIVVLQSTTILLQRSQSGWTFHLVEASLNDTTRERERASLSPVLAPWNPHLLLLALCCLQCLFALGRVNQRHRESAVSLAGAGAVLTIVLLAAAILQGVHSSDLVHYPTMLVVGALWLHGLWFVTDATAAVDSSDPYTLFHNYTRAVAVPLAVLTGMIFGTRVWADALTHWVLLQIAATVGWMQLSSSQPPLLLRRVVAVLFLLLPTGLAATSTGHDDAWRYIAILAGSTGLLPLLAVSTVMQPSPASPPPNAIAGYVLLANNAALIALVATLANF